LILFISENAPAPNHGTFKYKIEARIEQGSQCLKREHRTTQRLFEYPQWEGYVGAKESTQPFVKH